MSRYLISIWSTLAILSVVFLLSPVSFAFQSRRLTFHSRNIGHEISTVPANGETSSRHIIGKESSLMSGKKESYSDRGKGLYYSDDCFGLIFLVTGLVAQDVVFSTCFVLLSGLAAYSFNKNDDLDGFNNVSREKLQKQFPAAVAGLTLLFVAPVTRVVIQPNDLAFLPERMSFSTVAEIGVCAISVVYSLVQSRKL